MKNEDLQCSAERSVENCPRSENSKTDEERREQEEEKLCKQIIKGLARRNRQELAMLSEIKKNTIVAKIITDLTRYRPIVLELI